jgi:hypothetical protein
MGRPSSARSVGVVARGNGGRVVPSILEAFTGGGRTESRHKLELRWQMGRGSICCSGTRQARSTCSRRRWPSPPPQGKDSWR